MIGKPEQTEYRIAHMRSLHPLRGIRIVASRKGMIGWMTAAS
ncbi:MAG: hypothetical protein ACKOWD_19750 [Rhodoferax sp.]